ncbi:hypothetical protein GBA52_013931 [Prunus armeniaca]|nr:hypothetical protein GBA52_013931 [Prunus armeniaca]
MSLAINHCGSYGINSFTISSCKGGRKSSHGKYMVPIRMLKGPYTSTPQDLSQDLASLAKSDTSSSFPFKTVVNSMAGNRLTAFVLCLKPVRSNSFPSQEGAVSVYTLADGGPGEWFGGFLFSAGQEANEAVQDQLSALSFSSQWSPGPTSNHLLVLIQRLLPLQPHLLVELLDERLHSAVQIVLTQRGFLPEPSRAGRRTQQRRRVNGCAALVRERLGLVHLWTWEACSGPYSARACPTCRTSSGASLTASNAPPLSSSTCSQACPAASASPLPTISPAFPHKTKQKNSLINLPF